MKFLVFNQFLTLNLRLKLTYIFLLICVISLFIGGQALSYAEQTNARLWKIDKNGFESSYILATMHSEDPRILNLPENLKRYFLRSQSFTAEIDLGTDNTAALTKTMMLPKNKTLSNIIGDELFNKSVTILTEFGIPKEIVNQMKPWAVLMTLSYPKPKTGLFLDKLLFDEAIKMKKKCYGLETVQEQIAIFDNTSYLHQRILLRDSITQYPNFSDQLESLKLLYLKGDLNGLANFNKQIMLKGNYRVAQKLMTLLIDKRNVNMVQRMQARLIEGNAFIAVGALHLPGEKGILQLLRDQQYQVTAIR